MNPPLRELAARAVALLQEAGFTAYWAGGCVRDMLLGRQPADYDIATSATPDEVMDRFPSAVGVGKSFGVVRVPVQGTWFEVATFRRDHGSADGRRPEKVVFSDPRTDAGRRDFTINALFYDPVREQIHDFVGGQADLAARLLRCVGEPAQRFAEDHLRMLRAARFAATLDLRIHPDTATAVRRHAGLLPRISAERIRDELTRLLVEAPRAGQALRLLDALALLEVILPEVKAMQGQQQPPAFHPEGDVFEHTVAMLDRMEKPTLRLAYAVLLHDVGKPPTAQAAPDRIRFHGHASEGADMAAAILKRLRFSNADAQIITTCVRDHMRFMDVRKMRPSTLRRLLGRPTFALEMELHRLDCLASHGDLSNWTFLKEAAEALADEPVLPDPWITGRDIIEMGIPEGPEVGRWRRVAYDAQIENRFKTPGALRRWLHALIHKHD
jgi:poly(A) polymerase